MLYSKLRPHTSIHVRIYIYTHINIYIYIYVWDEAVGIVTRYELEGSGFNLRQIHGFPSPSAPPPKYNQPPVNMRMVSFQTTKRQQCGKADLSPSSSRFRECVDLYLQPHSMPCDMIYGNIHFTCLCVNALKQVPCDGPDTEHQHTLLNFLPTIASCRRYSRAVAKTSTYYKQH